jgi:hypothetical protein
MKPCRVYIWYNPSFGFGDWEQEVEAGFAADISTLLIYGIVRDEKTAVGWDDCVESGRYRTMLQQRAGGWLVGFWVISKRYIVSSSIRSSFVGGWSGGNERVVGLVRYVLALYHEQA